MSVYYDSYVRGFDFVFKNGSSRFYGTVYSGTISETILITNSTIYSISVSSGDAVDGIRFCWVNDITNLKNCSGLLGTNSGDYVETNMHDLNTNDMKFEFVEIYGAFNLGVWNNHFGFIYSLI